MAEIAITGLADHKAERISVAVGLNAEQLLVIAAGFSFTPEAFATAGIVYATLLANGGAQAFCTGVDQPKCLTQLVADDRRPKAIRTIAGEGSGEGIAQVEIAIVQGHSHLSIGAETIRATLARQRSLILDLYYNECSAISEKLSQTTNRAHFNDAVLERIEEYRGVLARWKTGDGGR